MRWLLVAGGLAACSCIPENGPLMKPGQDCIACHGGDSAAQEQRAKAWSIAGTLYAASNASAEAGIEGGHVQITDSNGWTFTLQSNQAGNFYSAEQVAFPLTVCVDRGGQQQCMEEPVTFGSCNFCHTVPPVSGAPGRVTAP